MNYWDFVHNRSHAVIEGALRAAAERGITCEATLAGIADANSPSNRYDRRAQRIWHDELYHQMGENRRHAAVVRAETRGGVG
jgi:hypothetical protein